MRERARDVSELKGKLSQNRSQWKRVVEGTSKVATDRCKTAVIVII